MSPRGRRFGLPPVSTISHLLVWAILGALLLGSARMLAGELVGLSARNTARDLVDGRVALTAAALREADSYLQSALAISGPSVGNLQLRAALAGKQADWLSEVDGPSVDSDALNRLRQASLQLFRLAIREQPSWPYNWMSLAQAKLAAGENDEEFRHAFRQGLRLGSQERLVQEMALSLLTASWPTLAADPVITELFQ